MEVETGAEAEGVKEEVAQTVKERLTLGQTQTQEYPRCW